ncbi:DNA polymerase III subunit gamma and tau [Isoptericola halotolerans]|uniref:DNA-directed DNA polymerase n=2 Tax=Isoptericola halotolerans TaxID=300560 RepID=A0ABX2A2P0_9MICO|nr:DNA polymerase-3 subunit gamma/tau [Isoptericola halotolerans]
MTTALYRRYRPETFAEVIGQEHVTAPLMQALRSGRVNHAYLFSGPRGCGKTTSARILARTLNCASNTPEKPLDTPCGECPSCVELARGGSGSLDVVEIDAASHNGVDDARDLRERATFAPARDRYKIFILDEAHMVTQQGFNALLKIVEEPPPHIKFVFATTEPDKVIGTIRSRTHHYPFRLVPPDVLGPYLEELCGAEGVEVGGGVVPLVTRAGGGSVRDSLSVMDQLIAGATGGSVGYDTAVNLLGFTHATLLDDVVDALAARDGASIFRVVDQVIATGHEPRRFVEDILERLRDLVVIAVSGDAAEAVLRGLPADQLERMTEQASHLGLAELSRAADLVNSALTEMTGATSPRLHLELLCARLLLPGADHGTDGLAARIDRLERGAIAADPGGVPAAAGERPAPTTPGPSHPRPTAAPTPGADAGDGTGAAGSLSGAAAARAALRQSRRPVARDATASASSAADVPARAVTPEVPGAAPAQVSASSPAEPSQPAAEKPGEPPAAEPAGPATAEPTGPQAAQPAVPAPARGDHPLGPVTTSVEEPVASPRDSSAETAADPVSERSPERVEQPPAPAQPVAEAAAPAGPAEVTAELVRRRWDEVVANLSSPVTRALVGPNAQVASLSAGVLTIAFDAEGMARAFSAQPRHVDAVVDAVFQTLGVQVRLETTVGAPAPAASPAPARPSAPELTAPATGGQEPATPDTGSPGTGSPGTDAPDVDAPDDPWPDVPVPGGPGAGPQGSARPAPAGQPEQSAQPVPPAQPDHSAQSAADAADAAWLAGPSASPDGASPPAGSVSAAAPTATPAATSQQTAAPSSPAQTPRQAAEQAAAASREREREESEKTRPAAGGFDDASDDDPDISSTGLMGVPLVVKVLDGTVVDEVVDQP